jgi:MFS family permease
MVWATGLLAYVVAVLDRTTLGVSGLAAADRFDASPSLLSTFVVLQVVVYAGAQVPAGILLDRYGSRVLIVAGAALMASGQLLLALTESLPLAISARAVVGLGDALTFISVLRLVPRWFEPRRVPLLTQLTGICGQLGQVLSALPFLALLTGTTWATAYVSVAAAAAEGYRDLSDSLHSAGYLFVGVIAAFLLLVYIAKRVISAREARHLALDEAAGAHADDVKD